MESDTEKKSRQNKNKIMHLQRRVKEQGGEISKETICVENKT
jgi:hypothetical protein